MKEMAKMTNCWVCEGWSESVIRWVLMESGNAIKEPIYIHFEYMNFKPLIMEKFDERTYSIRRMFPSGLQRFFFTFGYEPITSKLISHQDYEQTTIKVSYFPSWIRISFSKTRTNSLTTKSPNLIFSLLNKHKSSHTILKLFQDWLSQGQRRKFILGFWEMRFCLRGIFLLHFLLSSSRIQIRKLRIALNSIGRWWDCLKTSKRNIFQSLRKSSRRTTKWCKNFFSNCS